MREVLKKKIHKKSRFRKVVIKLFGIDNYLGKEFEKFDTKLNKYSNLCDNIIMNAKNYNCSFSHGKIKFYFDYSNVTTYESFSKMLRIGPNYKKEKHVDHQLSQLHGSNAYCQTLIIENLCFERYDFEKLAKTELHEFMDNYNATKRSIARKELIFKNCRFAGCIFTSFVENITFENCTFNKSDNKTNELVENVFVWTSGSLHFKDSTVNSVLMTGKVSEIRIEKVKSLFLKIYKLDVDNLLINDSVISKAYIDKVTSCNMEINSNEWSRSLVMLDLGDESDKNLIEVLSVYEKISKKYRAESNRYLCRIYYLMGKYIAELYKNDELDTIGFYESKLDYFMFPVRIIWKMIFVILVFSIFYLAVGIANSSENQVKFSLCYLISNPNINVYDFAKNYFDSLYFSVVSFTTIGYGDYKVIGLARIIPMVESMFSIIMIGILSSSIFKRYH